MQLYVVSGNGERQLLREFGKGVGIKADVGVLNLSAPGAHEVIVAVDILVITQCLTLIEAQFGHLPGLDKQGEGPIDRRRPNALDPFAHAVKDLARRRVVIRFGDHVQYCPALWGQPELGRAHASAVISSHHWQYQSCPTRTRSLGCQQ